MSKVKVKGLGVSPLFKQLADDMGEISSDFTKFLITKKGIPFRYIAPEMEPIDFIQLIGESMLYLEGKEYINPNSDPNQKPELKNEEKILLYFHEEDEIPDFDDKIAL